MNIVEIKNILESIIEEQEKNADEITLENFYGDKVSDLSFDHLGNKVYVEMTLKD